MHSDKDAIKGMPSRQEEKKRRGEQRLAIWMGLPAVLGMAAMGIYSMMDADAVMSAVENRALKTKPAFSLSTLLDGSLMKDWDAYYSDTFPLREQFFSATSKLSAFRGLQDSSGTTLVVGPGGAEGEKDLGQGEVVRPDENELPTLPPMTEGPRPSVTPDPDLQPASTTPPPATPTPVPTPNTTPTPPPNEGDPINGVLIVGNRAMELYYRSTDKLTRYAEFWNTLARTLPQVSVYNMVVPTSAEFYAPAEYRRSSNSQKAATDTVYDALSGVTGVSIYDALEAHQQEDLYFRTDHHWTALGAYYAYVEFCKAAGLEAVPLSEYESGQIEGFVGSMYRETMTSAASQILKREPDVLTYYMPFTAYEATAYPNASMQGGYRVAVVSAKTAEKTTNKYLTFLGGDHPLLHIRTQNQTGRKLIVYKESFGNALVPFLLPHYDEIFVVDPRNIDDFRVEVFAKAQGVTDILAVNYTFAAGNTAYYNNLKKTLP